VTDRDAPFPPPQGIKYYHNTVTKVSTWDRPPELDGPTTTTGTSSSSSSSSGGGGDGGGAATGRRGRRPEGGGCLPDSDAFNQAGFIGPWTHWSAFSATLRRCFTHTSPIFLTSRNQRHNEVHRTACGNTRRRPGTHIPI